MARDVSDWFIKQYEGEVHVAYQRKGSRLRETVRNKTNVVGSSDVFPLLGTGVATTKQRHAPIVPMNPDHSTVEVFLKDFYAGEWIDKLDENKMLPDEKQAMANTGAYALGRRTDQLIVEAINTGTAAPAPTNLSTIGLSYFTGIMEKMGDRDVPLEDGEVYGPVSWQLWNRMMNIDQFVNQDYIGHEQLPFLGPVGQAKRWLGVVWFPFSGLAKTGNNRRMAVYHKTAIGHASGQDVTADITWHGDRASYFVNNMMSQGAVVIDPIGIEPLHVNEAG
jgi:hypothetical protein